MTGRGVTRTPLLLYFYTSSAAPPRIFGTVLTHAITGFSIASGRCALSRMHGQTRPGPRPDGMGNKPACNFSFLHFYNRPTVAFAYTSKLLLSPVETHWLRAPFLPCELLQRSSTCHHHLLETPVTFLPYLPFQLSRFPLPKLFRLTLSCLFPQRYPPATLDSFSCGAFVVGLWLLCVGVGRV